jgi:hypothetical protein
VLGRFTSMLLANEAQQRTMLRLSLEMSPEERAELPLRQGRGIAWFAEALAPLRSQLSTAEVRRLALAMRAAVGIEALVWLTDVGGLARADAVRLMEDSARALLRAAVAQAPKDRQVTRRRR